MLEYYRNKERSLKDVDKFIDNLSRTSVGFDRIFDNLFNEIKHVNGGFPPHNIIDTDNDSYIIEIALAGYNKEDISVEQVKQKLIISSDTNKEVEDVKYLYKGIAKRSINLSFVLDEHIKVIDAKMDNGMLRIKMQRIIPEEQQPKKIEIL